MTFCLVATAKNEGPNILEWVAYHQLIGFERILVYQNDSDDLTHQTLKWLHKLGHVVYSYNKAGAGRHQVRAYIRSAKQEWYKTSRWAMALDLDEFLVIHAGNGTLTDLIAALPDADMVNINWRHMGSSGHTTITDDLVTAKFDRCERENRINDFLTAFKTLFRTDRFIRCGVHNPLQRDHYDTPIIRCNGSGLLEGSFGLRNFRSNDPAGATLARVHHYITKDAASFVVKSARGSGHLFNREVDRHYWQRRNFNEGHCEDLVVKSDQIWRRMIELDEQSGGKLMQLRSDSIKIHQDRFAKLMEMKAHRDLYAFCCETGQTRLEAAQ